MHVIGMKIEIRYFKKVTDTTFQHIFFAAFFSGGAVECNDFNNARDLARYPAV